MVLRSPFLLVLLLATSLSAHAGRGRHGVEDAELLEPGECVMESAVTRLDGGAMRFLLEPACRVGPVQLSAETEHTRLHPGSRSEHGLEVKWSTPLNASWKFGAMLRPAWEAHERPLFQGAGAVALATWHASEDLALHFNAGRDVAYRGTGSNRGGMAAEWAVQPAWTLMAERYLEERTHFARAAVRWAGGKRWMLDVGRAQKLAGPQPSQWGIGLSIELSD